MLIGLSVLVGLAVVGLGGLLVYGAIQIGNVPRVRCEACAEAAEGEAINVLVVGSDSRSSVTDDPEGAVVLAENIAAWSRAWVEQRGRPIVTVTRHASRGSETRLTLTQRDTLNRGVLWPQRLTVTVGDSREHKHLPLYLRGPSADVSGAEGLTEPVFVLGNAPACTGTPPSPVCPSATPCDTVLGSAQPHTNPPQPAAPWCGLVFEDVTADAGVVSREDR